MPFDIIKDKNKKVHFIGIGGVSMSALAQILFENGYTVSGSDMNASKFTEKLAKLGVTINIGHKKENVADADLIVYTAAIPETNPEIIAARENNIPLITRATFLGDVMRGYSKSIAIAGTHGKTTTTSMMAHIMLQQDKIDSSISPTILVGGDLDVIEGNISVGSGDYFLTEACEYKESFLEFHPFVGVILNIDEDHLDFYKDIHHIKSSFKKFIDLIPSNGYLVANAEDENLADLLNANCNIVTFGIDCGDVCAKNVDYTNNNCASFDVYLDDNKLFAVQLSVPGRHNVLNSLSVIATAFKLGFDYKAIAQGLNDFHGTHRRYEFKGEVNRVKVIDDYAHHPSEIKATIATAKNGLDGKLLVVFQPHTYTRTITLFDEFAQSFDGIDDLVIADIYAAREIDKGEVNSQMLSDAINKYNPDLSQNLHSFEEIVDYFKKTAKPGDTIITMGAGDVYKIGEMFLEK